MSLDTLDCVKACCQILEDKKAMDITVLDMRGKSNITDYFVIATAMAEPHLKALNNSIQREFKGKVDLLGVDYVLESGWLVLDGFDFMVHLFLLDKREEYGLEQLWRDAKPLDWRALLDDTEGA
ncbi:MAG: ribosome silencing factor [Opitutales bacterium]